MALLVACSPDRGGGGGTASIGSSAGTAGTAESGEGSGGSDGESGSVTASSTGSSGTATSGTSGSTASDSGDPTFDVGDSSSGSSTTTGGTAETGGEPPLSCDNLGEQVTNQGCEFWAVDLAQAWWSDDPNNPTAPENGQFAVAVANASSNTPANVQIFQGAGATAVASSTIAVDGLFVFNLPALNIAGQGSSSTGTAYRIESDVPVTAYQFNTLEQTSARFSADASLLIPVHVLQNDYATFTSDGFSAQLVMGGPFLAVGGYVSIVATQDATTVDVYPTYATQPGAGTIDVVLNRGQVLNLVATASGGQTPVAGEGNLTGTRIAADKPVAVFSGNVASREPAGTITCCADHVEEQMLPLSAWGTSYMANPPMNPNMAGAESPAMYRIMGGFDGTTLTWSPSAPPGAPTTINAYQPAYFQTNQAFTVTGSQAFGLAQFYASALMTNGGLQDPAVLGDPSMVMLPAVDQLQDSYIFLVPPTFVQNYVNVIRPAGVAITLDGAMVTQAPKAVGTVAGVPYESIQVPLTEGPHRISGDQPFQITVYGYAQQISYGYPGGSGLKSITEPPPPPVG